MTNATDKQKALMSKLNIEYDDDMTLETAKVLIEQVLGHKKPVNTSADTKKPYTKSYDTSSYYVAYAKDLVVAMLPLAHYKEVGITQLMNEAVNVIKLARNEFKNG